MVQDVVRNSPHLFLGSRLKRLGERMQAEVSRVVEQAGLPVQPAQYPVLAALDVHGPLSIGELVEATGSSQPGVTRTVARLADMGLVEVSAEQPDRRVRRADLTEAGRALMVTSRREVWPRVEFAARDLCQGVDGSLLTALDQLEAGLDAEPLDRRARRARTQEMTGLEILPYSDDLAQAFHDINVEWIEQMFVLEPADRESLERPRETIIDPGGDILFVRAQELGIVGTCALRHSGNGAYELTKMGVLARARGRKAGEFLLHAAIGRARTIGARKLYLLTNSRCEAAIHLYEKAGFQHDAGVMADHGARYQRADVAMRHPGFPG